MDIKKGLILLLIILLIYQTSAINLPQDCSNSQIISTWESIFREDSLGVIIHTSNNVTENRCTKYFVYKITENHTFYMLGEENLIQPNSTYINVVVLNATTKFRSDLEAITNIEDVNSINFDIETNSFYRPIPLSLLAIDSEFSEAFDEEPSPWNEEDWGIPDDTIYTFSRELSEENYNLTKTGIIAINHSYAAMNFEFLRSFTIEPEPCDPDWDCTLWGPCTNGNQTRVCIDLNTCGNDTTKPAESQNCTTSCTPNWDCTAWSNCTNSLRTRTCIDLNNCSANRIENINCTCSPNWTCTEWGLCIGNTQTRTCSDLNFCNINTGKPTESQSCGTICTPNWNCTDWHPKKCPSDTKTQTRNCTDTNNCGTNEGIPEESQSCTNTFGWMFWFVLAIVVILIGGTTTIIWERKKENKLKQPIQEQYFPPTQNIPIEDTSSKISSDFIVPSLKKPVRDNFKKIVKPKPQAPKPHIKSINEMQKPRIISPQKPQIKSPKPYIPKPRRPPQIRGIDPRFRKRRPF